MRGLVDALIESAQEQLETAIYNLKGERYLQQQCGLTKRASLLAPPYWRRREFTRAARPLRTAAPYSWSGSGSRERMARG